MRLDSRQLLVDFDNGRAAFIGVTGDRGQGVALMDPRGTPSG